MASDDAADLGAIRARLDTLAAALGMAASRCQLADDLPAFLAAYDAQAARLAALERIFVKVRGRWHIRTSHGSMSMADDIAYLVARAIEHPEWPEDPGTDRRLRTAEDNIAFWASDEAMNCD